MSTRSLGLPGALAIASAYPLWSVLAGLIFQGEALGTLRLLGVALTVLGTVTVVLVATHRLRGIQQRSREQVAALAKPPGVTTNVMAPYGTPHDHRVVRVREWVAPQVLVVKAELATKTAAVQVFQPRRVAAVFPAA